MARSAGFNLGGTYPSTRQQQQHGTSVSSAGVTFTPGSNQDLIHLHGYDMFSSSHGTYHSQRAKGHVFNIEAEKQALRNINSLALFSNIEVNPRADEKNEGGIIVEIKLKELEQKSAEVNTEWSLVPGRNGWPALASIQPGGTTTFEHRNIKGLNRSIVGFVTSSNLLNPQDPLVTKGANVVPLRRIDVWEYAYNLQYLVAGCLSIDSMIIFGFFMKTSAWGADWTFSFPEFFVISNAIAAGYLVLSLPFSITGIICPHIIRLRFLLFIFDLDMVALTTAAGSAAASIVFLAHSGNSKANWVAICLRFDGFCQKISVAVVPSFVATVILMLMVVMSVLALRKH